MKIVFGTLTLLIVLCSGYYAYYIGVTNAAVIESLKSDPQGKRAEKVMLLTFPDGKVIPVNYLREGDTVYCGADGPWWRKFKGNGTPVTLLVQGEVLSGTATVELDNQQRVADVFSRLRPTVPAWLPAWLNGKLVVILLSAENGSVE